MEKNKNISDSFTDQSLKTGTVYSSFTNEYTLTPEMCSESELSRMDLGIAIAWGLIVFVILVQFPSIPALLEDYFLEPSLGTILSFSGITGITFISPLIAIICLFKAFPQLVGEKRYREQLQFVPGEKRQISFFEDYVKIQGTFSKKLPYHELKRTGQTRNLYLLFFSERRMVIVPKAGFRKGTLSELKDFIRTHRTRRSKIYGVLRYLPVLGYFLLFAYALWME